MGGWWWLEEEEGEELMDGWSERVSEWMESDLTDSGIPRVYGGPGSPPSAGIAD